MARANGKAVKKPVVAKKPGGITGKGFVPGRSGNPGGRLKDTTGFRERCRERTLDVIEYLEYVFFNGTWPDRAKRVTDTVRMSAGIMLVSHGWGTPPNSHDVRISLPAPSPRTIDQNTSPEEAMKIYQQTLSQSALLTDESDERPVIDVTPNPPDPSGEGGS